MFASLIVVASFWYTSQIAKRIAAREKEKLELWAQEIQEKARLVNLTNELFRQVAVEERKKVVLWASAMDRLNKSNINEDLTFFTEIISSNTTIPIILVDEKGVITDSRNLDPEKEKDPEYLMEVLEDMKSKSTPIEIDIYGGRKNYLYFKDSRIFDDLKQVMNRIFHSFQLDVVINSATVPVIYTDSSKQLVFGYGNIDSNIVQNSALLQAKITEMEEENKPITISLGRFKNGKIFYQDSTLLKQLKYYPVYQLGVFMLFLFISYYLFSTFRDVEQNQVWVGMAKETAHQLGTPLSSLIAWKEYLKLKNVDESTLEEIQKDLDRLNTITQRFSKIGAKPDLEKCDLIETLNNSINYLKKRISDKVDIQLIYDKNSSIAARLNPPLFEWVMENIIRNAVDAMEGEGWIKVHVMDQVQYVYIDIEDNGKGIPRGKQKTIFEPGYTSKNRGWGLGLSLAKRIIENYHQGKIFVKNSEIDKGSCFRIVLRK